MYLKVKQNSEIINRKNRCNFSLGRPTIVPCAFLRKFRIEEWPMKTRDIHFLIMVVVVVGFLAPLSVTGRQRSLTRTPPHLSAASDMECFSCHDEGKQFPMTKEHPLRKKNCRQCHRLQEG